MLLSILTFLVGLVLIVKGADWLTDGASSIARSFNIPSIVIGLTIVAFGTSAPELTVSVVSAINGQAEMAIGNVVGSNIFNSLAIMGITALIYPVACSAQNIRYDVPLALVASIALVAQVLDGSISLGDGIVLLCFFAIFMSYTMSQAKGQRTTDNGQRTTDNGQQTTDNGQRTVSRGSAARTTSLTKPIILFLVGLAGLILGGNWMVDGASDIAAMLGVSQSVIALTIVAAGTSFPELVTSIIAARKGDTDMAMGNVVGSNVMNIVLILGVASTIHPLGVGTISMIDFGTLLGSSVLLWLFCRFGRRYHYVSRTEGAILTLCAVAYYVQAVLLAG